MLDFKSEKESCTVIIKENKFRDKIKKSLEEKITARTAKQLSFFSLASLVSACNFGGGSDSVAPLNISAIKGPLSGALAFIDRDGDGVYDEGEEFAVTGSTGGATISPASAVSATDKLVITSIAAGQTIGGTTYATATVDTNTGGTIEDLVLKAPSNSTVVTPVTTMVAETGLSETAIKEVLGLPAEMDVLNFNPFKADLSEAEKTVALAAEKVALKVYTTISTIQASAKSSGLDVTKAFETAIEAVAEVVKEQSAAGAKADLADSSIINKVVTKTETVLTTKLQESGFDAAAVTAAVSANKAVLETAKAQIKTVNEAADAIASFDATELGAIAKLAVKSGQEAAAAVTAEKAAPGSGAASFTMKTAEAVATAKATAKAEVQEAKGEEAEKTTETTASSASSQTKAFVLTDGTTVNWGIDVTSGNGGDDTGQASYSVSSGVMTIELGQGFDYDVVKALLESNANLTFGLSLASLPTQDDPTNTGGITITDGADGTRDSGEGQIALSSTYGYKATSTTQTTFSSPNAVVTGKLKARADGNSEIDVSLTKTGVNTFTVANDGTFGNKTGQPILELGTNNFLKIANDAGFKSKADLITHYVKTDVSQMHLSFDTADLNLYNGSTKINKVETVLSIGDNPKVGGVMSGTPRTGQDLTATAITDKDGVNNLAMQWKVADSANGTYSNIAGATGLTYKIANNMTGKFIKFTATYQDGQGNNYTHESSPTSSAVVTNNAADGSGTKLTISGGNYVGSTLTANTSGITDADGLTKNAAGTAGYETSIKWQKTADITASTPSWSDITGATGTTYTIKDADVTNKTTAIRANVSVKDDTDTTEIDITNAANGTTAKIAKPILYLKKEGTATADKLEIGIYLDDELIPTDATQYKKMKVWEVQIKPDARWDANFESKANMYEDSNGDTHTSYLFHSDGGLLDNSKLLGSATFKGVTDTNITGKFTTGGVSPKATVMDGGDGKGVISPQGTGSVINLNTTSKFSTTDMAAHDIKLASLFFNPIDAKVTGSNVVKFNIQAGTHYDYLAPSSGQGSWATAGEATEVEAITGGHALAFLTDPYTFEFTM